MKVGLHHKFFINRWVRIDLSTCISISDVFGWRHVRGLLYLHLRLILLKVCIQFDLTAVLLAFTFVKVNMWVRRYFNIFIRFLIVSHQVIFRSSYHSLLGKYIAFVENRNDLFIVLFFMGMSATGRFDQWSTKVVAEKVEQRGAHLRFESLGRCPRLQKRIWDILMTVPGGTGSDGPHFTEAG